MTAPHSLSQLANSTTAQIVRENKLPTSFNGSGLLYAVNLGLMTAFTCLGVMLTGWLVLAILKHRQYDRWRDPVTIYRAGWACAGAAVTLRCAAEAMNLWAWDPNAATTAAKVQLLKRFIDPVSLSFGACWMLLLVLTYAAMVPQLRKAPYPIPMWARLPSLKRPAAVVLMSFAVAFGVAFSR